MAKNHVYSRSSKAHLEEAHPTLIKIAHRALYLTPYDIGISDGGRFMSEQRAFVEAGVSSPATLTGKRRSRHLYAWPLTPSGARSRSFKEPVSHALDFMVYVEGRVMWTFEIYRKVWEEAWKPASTEILGYPLDWGGNWKRLRDGPHVQLPWSKFPAEYADFD